MLKAPRITRGEIFCVIMTLCGVAVLLDFKLDGNFIGYIMGLNSAIFAGITVNLIDRLVKSKLNYPDRSVYDVFDSPLSVNKRGRV